MSTMTFTETTPRYRNFSNNMPSVLNPNAHGSTSLITVEKEPERDPEAECFMCRQAHVYVKPIGMQQERRVARHYPPPLTQAEIDQLSQKKSLTKQEARKLLLCYFPEIRNVKYFQLHKYHSCCYDPKHLNLCKNHITALQHERKLNDGHHHHHHHDGDGDDEEHRKGYQDEDGNPNRVSFIRIKIEPTKGIPTRFIGPAALPDSLANMLIKQVNRLENHKPPPAFNTRHTNEPYTVRRVNFPRDVDPDSNDDSYDDDDNKNDDDDDDDIDDGNDNNDQYHNGNGLTTHVQGKIMSESMPSHNTNLKTPLKIEKTVHHGDLVIDDLDGTNHFVPDHQYAANAEETFGMFSRTMTKKKRRKGAKKGNMHRRRKPKLKHWEALALQQVKSDACNCRHQVRRYENNQPITEWCRCKDNQHKHIDERRKSSPLPLPPPPKPPRMDQKISSPPLPPPKRIPKVQKVQKRSIGIDAVEPSTTEVALAYDPNAVDYDMIQEAIYYRTASGRLIKPETTNAFAYDTIPSTMMINGGENRSNKAEVLYMTPGGKYKPLEHAGSLPRGRRTITLSKPGTLYNGEAVVDPAHPSSNKESSANMPVLKLPSLVPSTDQQIRNRITGYRPTEFTLAKFNNDKATGTSDLNSGLKDVSAGMQKTLKPTYSNHEPTPNYDRDSTILANRRWFDQPLGDENLHPVHDNQHGLIAGRSREDPFQSKSTTPTINNNTKPIPSKNKNNCTIS